MPRKTNMYYLGKVYLYFVVKWYMSSLFYYRFHDNLKVPVIIKQV